MLRFYADKLLDATDDLTAMRVLTRSSGDLSQITLDTTTRGRINSFADQLAEMRLGMTLKSVKRLQEAGAIVTAGHFQLLVDEIQGRLRDELGAALLFCLRENAEYFEPNEPPFGNDFRD